MVLGEISSPQLQRYASSALNDQINLLKSIGQSIDLACADLRRLAALGSYGKYDQKFKPELVRLLGANMLAEAHSIDIPMAIGKSHEGEAVTTSCPLLLPQRSVPSYVLQLSGTIQ